MNLQKASKTLFLYFLLAAVTSPLDSFYDSDSKQKVHDALISGVLILHG